MKIDKQAKIDIYYLIFFWAVNETIKGDKYFTDKELFKQLQQSNNFLIFKKQKQNKKVKKKIDMFSRFIQGTFYIITNVKHWKGIKP